MKLVSPRSLRLILLSETYIAFITVRVSSHPAPISSVKEFPPALLSMDRRQFCEENVTNLV